MDAVTVTQVSEHQCIVRKIAQELAKIQILHLPQNACETIWGTKGSTQGYKNTYTCFMGIGVDLFSVQENKQSIVNNSSSERQQKICILKIDRIIIYFMWNIMFFH